MSPTPKVLGILVSYARVFKFVSDAPQVQHETGFVHWRERKCCESEAADCQSDVDTCGFCNGGCEYSRDLRGVAAVEHLDRLEARGVHQSTGN